MGGWATESDMQGHADKIEDTHSSFQGLSSFISTPFFYESHGEPPEKVMYSSSHELCGQKDIHDHLRHAASRMPSRTYRSKAFAIGSIVSSQIKYIVEETVKLYQEKKLMNILACQKIQQNAKSTEMNEHAHSGFLARLRKLSASNHARSSDCCRKTTLQGCVWGAPFGVSPRHRLAKLPSAMGENSNGAVEEDKSETQDKMVFSFQERVKSNGPLIALLILALIFGTRHQISRMMKAAGLDTKRSVILLYSCICVVKSVYGALKEAKDVGELIMFYMNVSKKENKSSEK